MIIREGYIIGIDPDVDKSGFAVLDCAAAAFVRCEALSFPELIDSLAMYAADNILHDHITVVMEDSDISCNWHLDPRDKKSVVAAKGRSVGMCHATARHLRECAENYGLSVTGIKPLKKIWKGKDGKISHAEIASFATGCPKKTNQEVRDAMLLSWNYANLPIRIKKEK